MTDIINRGTGAGGANTNVNGKSFEEKTSNEQRLLTNGFSKKLIPGYKGKNAYYLAKEISPTESIVYLLYNPRNYFLRKIRVSTRWVGKQEKSNKKAVLKLKSI